MATNYFRLRSDSAVASEWLMYMEETATIVLVVSVVLSGCVGLTASQSPATPQTSETTEETTSPLNLSLEVVSVEARWVPVRTDIYDPYPPAAGVIQVTVEIDGTLSNGTDPVGGKPVLGVANVSSTGCWWGGGCTPEVQHHHYEFANRTWVDGNVSFRIVHDGAHLFGPPVAEPYCENLAVWALGVSGYWLDAPAATDTAQGGGWTCTQSYP